MGMNSPIFMSIAARINSANVFAFRIREFVQHNKAREILKIGGRENYILDPSFRCFNAYIPLHIF